MNRHLLSRTGRLLSQYTTFLPICHPHRHHRHRQLSTTCSTLILPPTVFLGLGITLWTYKCLMMILFQNKIIYMPNIPPFSRTETVEDYARHCQPVQWKEDSLVTGDGVRLSLAIGDVPRGYHGQEGEVEEEEVVILYFQGNASSLPPRLPFLSDAIKMANAKQKHNKKNISVVAVSYRGFWTSTGKPSQKGIERDADAALSWVLEKYYSSHSSTPARPRKFVIWGQSIGAGVATNLAAHYLNNPLAFQPDHSQGKETTTVIPITSLILETPFTSIGDLLLAFYPQKWLPYHYLGPFLRSHWDSVRALQQVAQAPDNHRKKPNIFMLEAGSDEVVPPGNAQQLEGLCKTLKLDVERRVIGGALHSDVVAKRDGQLAIAQFLRDDI